MKPRVKIFSYRNDPHGLTTAINQWLEAMDGKAIVADMDIVQSEETNSTVTTVLIKYNEVS